jgi:hypothetical protein
MRVLALIGGFFLLFTIIGSLPGMSFHVYFGTEEGARKWHNEHSQNHDHTKTNTSPTTPTR